ncbi:hypothetical protein [Fenollaria sporofastidiosus]|uniref:hypothetical protein n=1 Tax=Fenollaria sporofastidiosus TaxID=2811778 RepID=UPI001C005340
MDYTVGLINERNIGDKITKGDLLFTISSNKSLTKEQIKRLQKSIVFTNKSVKENIF